MIQILFEKEKVQVYRTNDLKEEPIKYQNTKEIKYYSGVQGDRFKIFEGRRDEPIVDQIVDEKCVFDAPYENVVIICYRNVSKQEKI